MKKSKTQKVLDHRGLWLIILLGGLCVLIVINPFLKLDKFNPDKDICLEWDKYMHDCMYIHNNDSYCMQYGKCIERRPKIKCELNPEAEGCICDEHNNFTCLLDNVCISKNNESIEKWCNRCNGEILQHCIKSHEPDECEKNSSDWIWDNSCEESINSTLEFINNRTEYCNGIICYNTLYFDGIDCPPKICRKKTIYDYSCDELIRAWKNDLQILKDRTEWSASYYSKLGIYDIAIEKGCEI